MQVKFRHSETAKKHTVKLDAEGYYILASQPSNWSEDCFVAVKKSAVDVVPDPPIYGISQRFLVDGSEYMLAQVGKGQVVLVGLVSGNRLTEPIFVKNAYSISQEVMDLLSHSRASLITK